MHAARNLRGMGTATFMQPRDADNLLERAIHGDESARQLAFAEHTDRLKAMIRLRLHPQLRGRLDPSDVLQEAYLDVVRQWAEVVDSPPQSFFLWLRHIAAVKLAELHRRHLDVQARAADREVSILGREEPVADSASLAAQLLGRITSPSQAAIKAEERIRLQQALDALDPIDREVVALRHFEQLNNDETATLLGMSRSGASSRYVRAMRRLHTVLADHG